VKKIGKKLNSVVTKWVHHKGLDFYIYKDKDKDKDNQLRLVRPRVQTYYCSYSAVISPN